MGIRLDWEIEAEQSSVKGSYEDPKSALRRRMARLRIFIGTGIVLSLLGALYGVIVWRLRVVDFEIERALRDTVDAEVATIRVSDRNAFLNIQRSASDTWIQNQAIQFDAYQRLKLDYNVQLTGRVVASEVDGTRGRVQVEEIIDGVPYVQTWFYWRYNEGWRHVPPDYTFWGDLETEERKGLLVRYRAMDTAIAEIIATEVENWLSVGCEALPCGELPNVEIEIVPQEGVIVDWNPVNPWQIVIPSPYIGRARLDRPFNTALQIEMARLIADRLVSQVSSNVQPIDATDGYFLRTAVSDWLVGQFIHLDTESYLLTSFAERYGAATIGAMLSRISLDSDIRLLANGAGVPGVDVLEVDWRDYLSWRLQIEQNLHISRDEARFVALYETSDLGFERFTQPITPEPVTVIAIQPERHEDGIPALRIVARYGEGEVIRDETILFRLIDGVWKRSN